MRNAPIGILVLATALGCTRATPPEPKTPEKAMSYPEALRLYRTELDEYRRIKAQCQRDREKFEKKLRETRVRVDTTSDLLTRLESRRQWNRVDLTDAEQTKNSEPIETAKAELVRTEQEITEAEKTLKADKARVAELEKEYEGQLEKLSKRIDLQRQKAIDAWVAKQLADPGNDGKRPSQAAMEQVAADLME